MRIAIAIGFVACLMVGAGLVTSRAEDSTAANSLKIVVVGFHSDSGEADCVLFGSPEGFPSDSTIALETDQEQDRT